MRVFLDTNVLAAGFATRGLCSDIIREVLESHELVSSLEILAELKRILTKKFRVPGEDVESVLDLVRSSVILSEPTPGVSYGISDPDDNPHLSAAENAQCSIFITGDKELWSVEPIGRMRVISPREFWEKLKQ